jgi:predicted O-methyltransferase YrrM
MVKLNIAKRLLGRLCYDPALRADLLPGCPPLNHWFQSFGEGRIFQLPQASPWDALSTPVGFRTSFSMGDDTLRWLWHRLQKLRPRVIVEFGSGISTLLFATYAQQAKQPVVFISIEGELSWLEKTRSALAQCRLEDNVKFFHATIASLSHDAGATYAVAEDDWATLLNDRSIDFVLIDGPPSAVGRTQVFSLVAARLSVGANLFLDDAFRPGEQAAIKNWLGRYGQGLRLRGCYPLGKGMAWLTVHDVLVD